MKTRNIYLGNTNLNTNKSEITGEFVEIQNEKYYKIRNYNHMPDFFMTIVSNSDHWMFISSNGSLSAGRKNRNNALFPYYTDDKIHDYKDITGSKTIVLVNKEDRAFLWEPFSGGYDNIYWVERNIYKNIYGNKIVFEEINKDLGIVFRYGWYNSEKFGLIKKSSIKNIGENTVDMEVLDGIQNILPNGIDYDFQNEYSNLLDAYKKNELLEDSKLGLYMLSSIPVDRAEPSESLLTTTVWSYGLKEKTNILLSTEQLGRFRNGLSLTTETDVRARRGAYFINAELELSKDEQKNWLIVAEINQSSGDVANLDHFIKHEKNISQLVEEDIASGTRFLKMIVANADGLQLGNEELSCARHFSNTLFNVMRGGIFTNNYTINSSDFKLFVSQTNTGIAKQHQKVLNDLPKEIPYNDLHQIAEKTGDADFIRICFEYLPLTFSRRHGDPSRPWNQFGIETKNADGSPKSDYQGNWRDIFQNWEALSLSFPEYTEGMISKFVNASTADGYNPYRITRQGIDWECPDPDDPWAYIGYWGDHQIIYLEKFLELSNSYHPGKLDNLLSKDIFTYANVPYRIKSYEDIVRNPQDTITFDAALNDRIKSSVKQLGADARLLTNKNEEIYKVNLTEKILATMLAKLSNFIPEAGIWLNTQRPEWNDANNALVGNGVSMVTLYYLRRFLQFWANKFSTTDLDQVLISEEIKILFDRIFTLFSKNASLLEKGFSDKDRRYFADVLGQAGSNYRNGIYAHSFSGKKEFISSKELLEFANISIKYMDQSIRVNKCEDGLYNAYNLVTFSQDKLAIRYLYPMLEGQVSVLSAGYLSAQESLDVLDSLKSSDLFRADQYSYILYPNRQLPLFTEKNNIPGDRIKASKLLSALVAKNDQSIVTKDNVGNYHFDGSFRNAEFLSKALDKLENNSSASISTEDKQVVLDIYEELFDHQSFTGRSGTFYGYEGLGSIYWHMVSKLLLAVQENYISGHKAGVDPVVLGKIKDHYYEIKAGIGLSKSPELYGAFPTDAYSHTPGNAGAKQPGMTGQVKEDFISRLIELGVSVENGQISFNTTLLNPKEILEKDDLFEYFAIDGKKREIKLHKGQLAFTFCQIPIIYISGYSPKISVSFNDNQSLESAGHTINKELSASIFNRSGEISKIEVFI